MTRFATTVAFWFVVSFGLAPEATTSFPYTRIEECIVRDNENSGISGSHYEVDRSVIVGNQNTGW